MSLVIQISKNKKIILPPDPKNQDEFIGLWLKAQQKAITKVTDEFIFKTYSQEEFDDKIDEVTYTIYKQLRNGGNNVYRRELKT
jgi:ferritin-like protein